MITLPILWMTPLSATISVAVIGAAAWVLPLIFTVALGVVVMIRVVPFRFGAVMLFTRSDANTLVPITWPFRIGSRIEFGSAFTSVIPEARKAAFVGANTVNLPGPPKVGNNPTLLIAVANMLRVVSSMAIATMVFEGGINTL